MSAKPLQLEGMGIAPQGDDPFDADLRKENARLGAQVLALRREIEDLRRDKERLLRSIENLRSILSPLFRGLRALFGEIEIAAGEESAPLPNGLTSPTPGTTDPRWQHFKTSFPGVPAAIIDALLIHEQMPMSHLAKLIGKHYDTVKAAAKKLREAGAATLDGGVLRLKR
jgi:hypothetical protein